MVDVSDGADVDVRSVADELGEGPSGSIEEGTEHPVYNQFSLS